MDDIYNTVYETLTKVIRAFWKKHAQNVDVCKHNDLLHAKDGDYKPKQTYEEKIMKTYDRKQVHAILMENTEYNDNKSYELISFLNVKRDGNSFCENKIK